MIDQLIHINGNIRARSAFSGDRLHIGEEESHRGAWQPIRESDCYNPGQRFTDYDLAYGIRNCNWPIGLEMRCCRPGHERESITFDGVNWINKFGIPRTFGILGKYERGK